MVFACYKLAKTYHVSPDEFLKVPLSRLQRHVEWTSKLIEETEPDDGPH